MSSLVGAKYGYALFEVGKEENKLEVFYNELQEISNLFTENPEISQVLTHPQVLKSDKKNLVNKIFQGHLLEELINFLYILIDKKRMHNIIEIIEEFQVLYNEFKNIKKAVVITVNPLSEEKLLKMKNTLEKNSNSTIVIENIVDKSIIGGAILEIDGKRIDSSIENELRILRGVLG